MSGEAECSPEGRRGLEASESIATTVLVIPLSVGSMRDGTPPGEGPLAEVRRFRSGRPRDWLDAAKPPRVRSHGGRDKKSPPRDNRRDGLHVFNHQWPRCECVTRAKHRSVSLTVRMDIPSQARLGGSGRAVDRLGDRRRVRCACDWPRPIHWSASCSSCARRPRLKRGSSLASSNYASRNLLSISGE
jgi:hypothetical protein